MIPFALAMLAEAGALGLFLAALALWVLILGGLM